MASPAYIIQPSDQNLDREQWLPKVSITQPQDAPIFDAVRKGRATSVQPQFASKKRDLPGMNVNAWGDVYSYTKPGSAQFASNITQRFFKEASVSNEAQAVSNVGMAEQIRDLVAQKSISMTTDFDYAIATAQGANAAEDTPIMGGVGAFLKTNINVATAGSPANPGVSATTHLPQSITAGTKRAFTRAMLDDVIKKLQNSGAMPKNVYMNLDKYEAVSTALFPGSADKANQIRSTVDGKGAVSVTTSVDVYMAPTGGSVSLYPDRSMTSTAPAAPFSTGAGAVGDNLLALDPGKMEWMWLITPRTIEPGVDGDYQRRVINAVATLAVDDERDHGAVFAIS